MASTAPAEIKFYKRQDPYYEFSNFAAYPIEVEGEKYPTNEHYYQASKFKDAVLHKQVQASDGPGKAFKIGRNPGNKGKIRSDWDDFRLEVMTTAIRAKFSQHDDLRQMLLATGDATIIEDSPVDRYWGVGSDGGGKNKLGIIIMQVRTELRESAGSAPA